MLLFAQNGHKKRIFVNIVFYTEAKFWPLEKGGKMMDINRDTVFRKTDEWNIFDHKKWRNFWKICN